MEIKDLYKIFKQCGSVTTDSRNVRPGELFFALKGENFDGNEYAVKALEAGAAYAVVSEDSAVASSVGGAAVAAGGQGQPGLSAEGRDYADRLIPVPDTLATLQALARYHRSVTFVDGKPLKVIGLTGTNGKTTTKELIKTVLSVKYNVTATEGNLNNSIGVPLSLLKIDSQTQVAVIEMGASHPGDIAELVSVALPDYGLVTNVGRCHLLGFGSFEGVMKAKGEMYDYIQRTADKAFVNVDNPYLTKMASERPDLNIIPYGVNFQGATVVGASAESPFLKMTVPAEGGRSVEINTHLVGDYNADNVMAALAVGAEFGIPLEEGAKAIESYQPSNSRSQLVRTAKNTLIVDAYNANPTSVGAALDNFANLTAEKKAVMLGDMLELGEYSDTEHLNMVKKIASMGFQAFLVGKEYAKALAAFEGSSFHHFDTSDALAQWLAENPLSGCTILVKGSRGTRMEKVIPAL